MSELPREERVAVEACLWALYSLDVATRVRVLDFLGERMRVAPTPPFPPPWRRVEMWYPNVAGNSVGIEVDLVSVRAARSIRIEYDFARDGYAITAQADPGDGEFDEVAEVSTPWREVAFVSAWCDPVCHGCGVVVAQCVCSP